MSEKDERNQKVDPETSGKSGKGDGKAPSKSREDRLAEALRANLRRRKSAAKSRDKD